MSGAQNQAAASGVATTGPSNPLYEFTNDEKTKLAAAEKASSDAYEKWKLAKHAPDAAERTDEIEDLLQDALDKEKTLKGLQDFCD